MEGRGQEGGARREGPRGRGQEGGAKSTVVQCSHSEALVPN